MKKLLLIFIGILSMSNSYAQDIQDAVRYSQDEILGTARFRAMSGAFGALGGDLSAVSINPAGSAVFTKSHASITLGNTNVENDVSYNIVGFNNGINNSSNSEFDLNQTGATFVFNNTNKNSDWKKFALSIAFDKTQNFDNDWVANGINSRSIDGYFLENAQGFEQLIFTPTNAELAQYFGISESSIANSNTLYYELGYQFLGEVEGFQQQQNFLGFQSFILEPDASDNTVYTSNIGAGNFDQQFSYAATGYNGKFSFNLATQYQDNLYLGINLNSHIINYDRITFFDEINNNGGSVTEVGFENTLSTQGSGFSFQVGGIAKLSDEIRVGVTYNSPTWLNITEETTQYLETVVDFGGTNPELIQIDPQIVNVFPDYRIKTPAKITGSAALVLDKKGLISFDYSRKDYSNTEFRPESDEFFNIQNTLIAETLKAASTYRVGGEYRIKNFSLRGGYRFEESPYIDDTIMGDLTGYSAGLGYSFGNTKIDVAFDQSSRDQDYQFFNTGFTDAANIDATNTNVVLTLTFGL